ncbi:MAG: hypothetical protein ACJATF_003022 [Flavobacteriales bacterium]|jgi:hypothetical protein
MFEFNGEWVVNLKLEEFLLLNNKRSQSDLEKANQPLFEIGIQDEFNENPDPEEYQINTINWLMDSNNQKAILSSLLDYCKNTIYPHYKTFMWESEYPDCYPQLNEIGDLSKLLSIWSVSINKIEKEGSAYYTFNCESCLDHEHGIVIGGYKDVILEHGGELEYDKIYNHKGVDPKKEQEKNTEEYRNRELKIWNPHPKYGKLKPWQKDLNRYYPFGLFHRKRDEELIQFLNNGLVTKEPLISRILELSIMKERENLTAYFIEQTPEYKFTPFKEALKKDRFDLTDKLIQQGFNINEKVAQSSLFYETIGDLAKAISKNEKTEIFTVRLNYLLSNGLDPYLEDGFNRNSLYRIKRIDDDLVRAKVEEEVMKILNPKVTKKLNSKLNLFDKIKRVFEKRKR